MKVMVTVSWRFAVLPYAARATTAAAMTTP